MFTWGKTPHQHLALRVSVDLFKLQNVHHQTVWDSHSRDLGQGRGPWPSQLLTALTVSASLTSIRNWQPEKCLHSCRSWPIRGKYPGHMIILDQSEVSKRLESGPNLQLLPSNPICPDPTLPCYRLYPVWVTVQVYTLWPSPGNPRVIYGHHQDPPDACQLDQVFARFSLSFRRYALG